MLSAFRLRIALLLARDGRPPTETSTPCQSAVVAENGSSYPELDMDSNRRMPVRFLNSQPRMRYRTSGHLARRQEQNPSGNRMVDQATFHSR